MTAQPMLPDVQVEVAWNVGYAEGIEPVWTDISTYVELNRSMSISRGRQNEFSVADGNTLSLVFDNRDGRFTAGNTTSPYYPNVRLGRRIRVTATPDGGGPARRFTGYVTKWPTEWPTSEASSYVSITAVSRLARLGHSAELASIVSESILVTGPVAYWPLGEGEDAVEGYDVTTNMQPALAIEGDGADVLFGTGTGVGTDDQAAPTFASGKWLAARSVRTTTASASTRQLTLAMFVRCTAPGLIGLVGNVALYVNQFGVLELSYVPGPGYLISSISLTGDTQHVAVTIDADTTGGDGLMSLYVDGVLVETAIIFNPVAYEAPPAPTSALVRVGGYFTGQFVNEPGNLRFAGTMGHVALWDRALTATEVASIAQVGLEDGYVDELPGARLARYAALGGVPAADLDLDDGVVPISHIDTTGSPLVDLMRTVEETDGGVLYDGASGAITYRERTSRYAAAPGVVLDMRAQHVDADFSPVLDDSALVNLVDAKTTAGSAVMYSDDTSREEYGTYSKSIELATRDADAATMRAGWLVQTYAEPKPRVPSLTVEITTLDASLQAQLLAVDIGTLVEVQNLPAQVGADTGRWFVEGIGETIATASHVLTFNLSPSEPFLDLLLLDDPVLGCLDSKYHLA